MGKRLVPLEAAGDVCAPQAAGLAEMIELRVITDQLPIEEREIMVLHYLTQGRRERQLSPTGA